MMDTTREIQANYNRNVEMEWNRLEEHPAEFELTRRYLDRYIMPGERVLDIGGGPGRYSLYLAKRGCQVTLLDLAEENCKYAGVKAGEEGVSLSVLCGDARDADQLVDGLFDHVLLMGPMYHLLTLEDRKKAMDACLALLKPGGNLYISFISAFAGMIYAMKSEPDLIVSQAPEEVVYRRAVAEGKSFAGMAFTYAYFAQKKEIEGLVAPYPLEQLHFFGQEGITAPCEDILMAAPPEVFHAWLDYSEKVCEREELLSYSEHWMYIGRKTT